MEREIIEDAHTSVPPMESVEKKMLPPPPPSRLLGLITAGAIIEVLTVVTIMLSAVSGQFSIFNYILALFGVLIPLFLAAWGFWLMTKDETRSQKIMRAWEQTRATTIHEDQQKPVVSELRAQKLIRIP